MIISSQGQIIVGDALPGSRRDYPEGWKDLRQEMALLGPVLFVRCTGDAVGGLSPIANPKYSLTVGKRTKGRLLKTYLHIYPRFLDTPLSRYLTLLSGQRYPTLDGLLPRAWTGAIFLSPEREVFVDDK
jgi:hypothetical protein